MRSNGNWFEPDWVLCRVCMFSFCLCRFSQGAFLQIKACYCSCCEYEHEWSVYIVKYFGLGMFSSLQENYDICSCFTSEQLPQAAAS